MKIRPEPEIYKFEGSLMDNKGRWAAPRWVVDAYRSGILYYDKTVMYLKGVRFGRGNYLVRDEGNIYVLEKKRSLPDMNQK